MSMDLKTRLADALRTADALDLPGIADALMEALAAITAAPQAKPATSLGEPREEPRDQLLQRLDAEIRSATPPPVTLIDAMEFRRDQYGLTCGQFARLLRICPSHYSEFIHGYRTLPLVARICAFRIGVPADVLLQPDPELKQRAVASGQAAGAQCPDGEEPRDTHRPEPGPAGRRRAT